MDRDRPSQLLIIDHVGIEAKDDTSEDVSTVNGIGTGHEA